MRRARVVLLIGVMLCTLLAGTALADHVLWFNPAKRVFAQNPSTQLVFDYWGGAGTYVYLNSNGPYSGKFFVSLDHPSNALVDSVIIVYDSPTGNDMITGGDLHATYFLNMGFGNFSATLNNTTRTRFAFDIPDFTIDGSLSLSLDCTTSGGGIELFAVGLRVKDGSTLDVVQNPDSGPSMLRAVVPNPALPPQELRFTLARAGRADLGIYDVAGRRVRQMDLGHLPAGDRVVIWDGRNESGRMVEAGTYFYELNTEQGRSHRTAIVLR